MASSRPVEKLMVNVIHRRGNPNMINAAAPMLRAPPSRQARMIWASSDVGMDDVKRGRWIAIQT